MNPFNPSRRQIKAPKLETVASSVSYWPMTIPVLRKKVTGNSALIAAFRETTGDSTDLPVDTQVFQAGKPKRTPAGYIAPRLPGLAVADPEHQRTYHVVVPLVGKASLRETEVVLPESATEHPIFTERTLAFAQGIIQVIEGNSKPFRGEA